MRYQNWCEHICFLSFCWLVSPSGSPGVCIQTESGNAAASFLSQTTKTLNNISDRGQQAQGEKDMCFSFLLIVINLCCISEM
jgi:hypothetical protein